MCRYVSVKVDFANVNSPILGFSTKIVPDLHGIFNSPKSVLSGDPLYYFFSADVTMNAH